MNKKILALTLGVLCHVLFILAVGTMAFSIYWGFTKGIYPIGGNFGRLFNLILLIQFPILHSFLLHRRDLLSLNFLADPETAKSLQTTVFALIASTQLLIVFAFWTPPSEAWFSPHGSTRIAWFCAYASAWIFLLKAMIDSGLALQTGFLGWSAVFKGEKPNYPDLNTAGTNALCRQPIYLAFALILLFAPVWSVDHFMCAIVWCSYCVFGPKLKERRLISYYGDRYRSYQQRVPYLIPRITSYYRKK